jgi:hypothetical protein
MSKLNQILVAMLVIQISLGVYTFWPSTTVAEAGAPLLADFSADNVTELTISDGEGNEISLAKNEAGWVLPQAGDFPADGEKIAPLLEKAAGVQSGRLVTETEGSQARLQVAADKFSRRLQITGQGGQTDTLYLGSSAGAGATHVRVNDQPEVYLTDKITAFDANAQASAWIDPLYFTVPQTATTGLTLENGNGTFEFVKSGEAWTLADLSPNEIVNQGAITALLNQAQTVNMTEPVGRLSEAGSAFDAPLATITLESGGQTYRLTVGTQDSEDSSYLFSASGSPYYVRVAQFSGDAFVTKSRADFLEAPPEPTDEEPIGDN